MGAAYQRLAAQLQRRITSGEWPPGSRVPSARILSEEYDLGRGTVVQAMATLRSEGFIEGKRGAPALVAPPLTGARYSYDPHADWPHQRNRLDHGPATRAATSDLAERLGVSVGARLRREVWECVGPDGWPAMLETTYRRGATHGETAGVRITVAGGVFAEDEARALGLTVGAAALRIRRTRYGEGGRPLETAHLVLRSDRWELTLR